MRIKILLLLVLLLQISLYSEYSNVITYASYIENIRDLIPELKMNAVQETNAQMDLLNAKGAGDVDLSASIGAIGKYGSLSSDISSTTASPTVSAIGMRANIGVGSLIPYSGTRWSVNLSHNSYLDGTLKQPNGVEAEIKSFQPSLTIEVTQPILRNFFGKLDSYPIKDAEYSLTIAKLQRKIDDASVIVAYQKMYYQWIMYEKLLNNYRNMYNTARRFEAQIRNRYQSGLVDNDGYQNARTQTLLYSDYYAQNKVYLDSLLNNIAFLLPDITNMKPDHKAWDSYLDLASNMTMENVAFADSVNGQIAYQSKIKAEYTLEAMQNNNLPDLSLVGQVNINGSTPNNSGYFNSFSSMTNVDFFAGVQFSYPLGNRANYAQYKQAENALYGIIAQYDKLDKDFSNQLQTYIIRFNTYKNLIDSKKIQIRAINSRINTQLQKLEQGRIEVDDIIQSRIDLVSTQTELLNLEYEFITTIFDYRALLAVDYE